MFFPSSSCAVFRTVLLSIPACLVATSVATHEAWLLTPAEIEALAREPMPAVFTSYTVLSIAAAIGCLATILALLIEERLQPFEIRVEPMLHIAAVSISPVVLRAALATMLALAGTGGLPRHGTAHWMEPTLLVPDMQLSLVTGWDWLAFLQIILAVFLFVGLFSRMTGLALIVLTGVGFIAFGMQFLSYAPHFIAPGVILFMIGAGPWSLDQVFDLSPRFPTFIAIQQTLWRLAQILIGAGFVYLAAAYKLTQPTLLIAILQHGDMPTFGLSYPVLALIMTGVEVICGALLIVGRLVRPVSLAIIGAITFLAITLGETPLFHANLYGTLVIFALAGPTWPSASIDPLRFRRVEA